MDESAGAGVRESRRRAMLAKSIVDQFNGPRAQMEEVTKKTPFLAVAAAFACGALVALLLRRR